MRKHQLYPFQIGVLPQPAVALIVVIPCYDEPDLIATLQSLWHCHRPDCATEVLVVINDSDTCDAAIRKRNEQTWRDAQAWITAHRDPTLRYFLVRYAALPSRHAGVGLARKLGMDEAVARLAKTASGQGIVVCLDADCRVLCNYLVAIWDHFAARPAAIAGSLYFEHILSDSAHGRVIAAYELHLRYYLQALRRAGMRNVYHTLGSCLAVRSNIYVRQGGMNRRKAGEDFYFVQKLVPLGGYTEISSTTVYPASRASHRVPFGTGKAVRENVGRNFMSYAPQIFFDLRLWLHRVADLTQDEVDSASLYENAPSPVAAYLQSVGFAQVIKEIRANTAGSHQFRQRFFRWFNPFRAMKYVRHATTQCYPMVPVEDAARVHLLTYHPSCSEGDTVALLMAYRRLEKSKSVA